MSYAQALLSSLFVQKEFKLSALPGLWVLSTDTAVGSTTILFNSCTVPTVYLASGLSYWYSGASRDWTAINWALCTGPEPPLPNFPWGSNVPTFTELVEYLQDNRFSGPCEGGGGGGTMTTLYSGNGELAGNRIVDFKDKLLIFYPSENGSAFAISRDGGTFPPTSLNQIAFRLDPDNFLGTNQPGLVLGYQNIPGGSGGDSAALQISQVTGQKAILITSSNEAAGKFITQLINDDNIILQANGGGGTTQLTLESGNIRVEGIPNATKNDVLYYDSVSKAITYNTAPTAPTEQKAIFSARFSGPQTMTGTGYYQIPVPGQAGLAFNPAFGDYNFAGLDLSVVNGTYSPSQTNYYEVILKLNVRQNGPTGNIYIQFYNVSEGIPMDDSYQFIHSVPSGYTTMSVYYVGRLLLEAAKIYVFRFNGLQDASDIQIINGRYIINKI